jgi:hypothetical protein
LPAKVEAQTNLQTDAMMMNASINPPSHLSSPESYQAECLFAIEPSVESLIGAAEEAGWKKEAIALAIVALAADLAATDDFMAQLS